MSKPQPNKATDTQGTPSYVLVSIIFAILNFALEGFKSSLGLGDGPSGTVNLAFVALGLALSFFWRRLQESRLKKLTSMVFTLSLWSYLLLVAVTPLLSAAHLPHGTFIEQFGLAAVLLSSLVLLLAVFYDAKQVPSLLLACLLGFLTSLGSIWSLLPLSLPLPLPVSAKHGKATAPVELEAEAEASPSEPHHSDEEEGEEIHASQFTGKGKPEEKPVRMAARYKDHEKGHTAPSHKAGKLSSKKAPEAESKTQSVHWEYEGDRGPEAWGDLSSDFRLCSEGIEQSPIDIPKSWPLERNLELFYRPSSFDVVDNGHTIQFNVESGNFMTVGGKRYELKQIHFHTPSEHFFSGRSSILEAHFVHATARGELAVLGSMIEPGLLNKEYSKIWAHLPKRAGETVKPRGKLFDPRALLPDDLSVYHYPGSLTTPPCSEKVNWNVLRETVQLSQDQINRFRSRYRLNARPIQPLHER